MNNRLQRRINDWESFFQKYKTMDCSTVYDVPSNSIKFTAEAENEQGFPEGMTKVVDDLWAEEISMVLRNTTSKDCNLSKSDKTGITVSMNDSSAGSSHDDDYESCDSDIDLDDAKDIQVSKNEFCTALLETSRSRTREIQRSRERFPCVFDHLATEPLSHKQGDVALSSPSRRGYTKSTSWKNSSSENDLSGALEPKMSHVPQEGNPSTNKHPSKTPSFKKNSSGALEFSRNLSPPEEKIPSTNENPIEICITTSKESSFSDRLRCLEIDSPSSRQTEDFKLKEVMSEHRISSALHENLKAELIETRTTPSLIPINKDRKRKILISPGNNCNRSLKLHLKECRVILSPVKLPRTVDHEANEGKVLATLPRTNDPKEESSDDTLKIPVKATLSSSRDDARGLFSTSLNFSKSSGKIISLDSSILRQKRNSERKSIRALTKGRSLFVI